MSDIKLSFVVTTRDKIAFLKVAMEFLLKNVNMDEEIVVVDGASTDGTKEFLQDLFQRGKIHQFISEPDFGEAHGLNKGMLSARGELLKVITDDDVFCYSAIRRCRDFMLRHKEVDVLATEGSGYDFSSASQPFKLTDYYKNYQRWKTDKTPFSFCGLGLMFRKSALPKVGLFRTGIVRVDHEYALRLTSGPGNFVWYTGPGWVHVANPRSNSVSQSKRVLGEGIGYDLFYIGTDLKKRSAICFKVWSEKIKNFKNKFCNLFKPADRSAGRDIFAGLDITNVFTESEKWLETQETRDDFEFLARNQI